MKKIVSVLLSVMLVVAMCCVGIPATATAAGNKATIHLIDFNGDQADPMNGDFSNLAGKGVNRGSFEFEVGDVVEVTMKLSSNAYDAISIAQGSIFMNQVSADPTSAEAFQTYTDTKNNTTVLTDASYDSATGQYVSNGKGSYYTVNTGDYGSDLTCPLRPMKAYTKDNAKWDVNSNAEMDQVSYILSNPQLDGIDVSAGYEFITFKMLVTEATECYMYSLLTEVLDTFLDNITGDDVEQTTTLKKVGHVELETPTEPETEAPTPAPTPAPTEAPTAAPTPAPTEAPTQPANDKAIIHLVDDNARETLVLNVGDTFEYPVYIKLDSANVYALTTRTYFNQPVGSKTTPNFDGDMEPNAPKVLTIKSKRNDIEAYWDNLDTSTDVIKDNRGYELCMSPIGPYNTETGMFDYVMAQNGTFDQYSGCLLYKVKFTVQEPGEVEVFTYMDEAIADYVMDESGKIIPTHAKYVAIYNELQVPAPTTAPTEAPTEAPTPAPTEAPTEAPTPAPTEAPTEAPTTAPTEAPTEAPTAAPTEPVTEAPTEAPTTAPVEHTYFAVGATPLFDPAWDPAAAKYQMFKNADGIYEIVIPVTEEMWDSDVAYKVAQDGNWDVSYNDKGLAEGLNTDAFIYIQDNTTAVRITFNTDTLCAAAECIVDELPTEAPTVAPTVAPTEAPTEAPTVAPTEAPTEAPTTAPTEAPTEAPTTAPTEAPTTAPVEHTYFAVGASPLFDPAWDPAAPNHQMFKNADGIFEIVIPVTEEMWDSDVAYKVAQDGTWDVSYNDKGLAEGLNTDAFVYIEEDTTAVRITFSTETLCASAECIKGEAPTEAPTTAPTEAPTTAPTTAPTEAPTTAPAEHTYFAVGAAPLFDPAWDPAAAKYQMFKNADGIFEIVIPVTEEMWDSDVAYKVAQDGTWDVSYNDKGLAEGLNTDAFVYIEEGATAVRITFNLETLCTSAECIFGEIPTEPETEAPTTAPTEPETEAPTEPETEAPTTAPTEPETEAPTTAPTEPETEAPTTEPEVPTAPSTQPPTEAPTQVVTEAPTGTSTEAPTGTSTEAPTSSATSNNSSTGKVPTGDSASVAILLSFIMMAAGAVVVAKRKITSK